MENIQLHEVIKVLGPIYGPIMTLLWFGWIIWERIINPKLKKKKGTYVSWKALKEQQDTYVAEMAVVKMEITKIKDVVNIQLEKEIEKERILHTVIQAQERQADHIKDQGYILRDLDSSVKTFNKLVGLLKDRLKDEERQ